MRKLIKDCFGESRIEEYRGKHKLDLLIVYGGTISTLTLAPGGRDNAVMVSKASFEALSLQRSDGNYFLRPDFILGAFLLDASDPPTPCNDEMMENEKQKDRQTKQFLNKLLLVLEDFEDNSYTSTSREFDDEFPDKLSEDIESDDFIEMNSIYTESTLKYELEMSSSRNIPTNQAMASISASSQYQEGSKSVGVEQII